MDECFEVQGWEGVEDWMGPSSNESNLADYTIRGGVTEVQAFQASLFPTDLVVYFSRHSCPRTRDVTIPNVVSPVVRTPELHSVTQARAQGLLLDDLILKIFNNGRVLWSRIIDL